MRGTFEEPPTGLIPWFSKTEGNTYATIAASPSPLRGKPTQAQDIAHLYLKNFITKGEMAMVLITSMRTSRTYILSDAVGVDGLAYLPSLPLFSLLDGLKPYLL